MSVKYGSTDVKEAKDKNPSENGVANGVEVQIRYRSFLL